MSKKIHRIAARKSENKIQWKDVSFSNKSPENYIIVEFDNLEEKNEFIDNINNKKCIITENNVIFEELKGEAKKSREKKLIDQEIKDIERSMYTPEMMNKVIDFIVSNDNFATENKDLVDDFKLKKENITKLKNK